MKKILFLLLFAGGSSLFAQEGNQLAFPGAEGFGKYTSGGRGGRVFYVTNLDDDGEGSLRWAVRKSGPKTILFKVSGTINLTKALDINKDSVTIAGQSAPGDGICIAGAPVKIKADNAIIRYVRFRMGDTNHIEGDALSANKSKNLIIDHCSMSWSTDEAASIYEVENMTLQNSIISESFFNSEHAKGEHGYGGIWGGKNASFINNLLAHHDSRNPRFDHPGVSDVAGYIDFSNNVIYNWGNNLSYGGETRTINMVNNYYKPGPAMGKNRDKYFVNPYNQTSKSGPVIGYGKFYLSGNVMEGNVDITKDNLKGVKMQQKTDNVLMATVFTPYPNGDYTPVSARDAYKNVLATVGASLKRDAVDERIINEVRTGKAKYGATYGGGKKGIIDSQNDVGGYPVLNSLPAPLDSDGDGIPDEWEIANGLNPNMKKDGNFIAPNGYTNLENYLNSLVEGK